jgi:hypothetical protein
MEIPAQDLYFLKRVLKEPTFAPNSQDQIETGAASRASLPTQRENVEPKRNARFQ